MLVYALVIVPLVRRGWIVRGLVLAAATLLALGLIFPPLASQYLADDLGPFGTDYGTATVISFILSSLVFGIVGARCHDLAASARWWTPRGEVLGESLEELDPGRRSRRHSNSPNSGEKTAACAPEVRPMAWGGHARTRSS